MWNSWFDKKHYSRVTASPKHLRVSTAQTYTADPFYDIHIEVNMFLVPLTQSTFLR